MFETGFIYFTLPERHKNLFKIVCAQRGISMTSALESFVLEYIREFNGEKFSGTKRKYSRIGKSLKQVSKRSKVGKKDQSKSAL